MWLTMSLFKDELLNSLLIDPLADCGNSLLVISGYAPKIILSVLLTTISGLPYYTTTSSYDLPVIA